MFIRLATCLFALFGTATPLFGELTWATTTNTFYPSVEDKVIVAEYYFKNTGGKKVAIGSIKAGCACCTTAVTDKTEYAPGENGKVVETYKSGAQFGVVEKKVTLTTSDANPEVYELKFVVHLKERFTITPERLLWTAGSKDEKEVEIDAFAGSGLRILGVQSTNTRLVGRLQVVDAALGRYKVKITPWGELEPLEAQLLIKSNFPENNPRVYQVPMSVARPSAAKSNGAGAPTPRNAPETDWRN